MYVKAVDLAVFILWLVQAGNVLGPANEELRDLKALDPIT